MRISDWSSDVCSSDLLAARRGGLPRPTVRNARRRGHDPRASGRCARRNGLLEQLSQRRRRQQRRRPAPPRDARARLAYHAAGRRDERSEEHTSELQSLMRISYAVFCLKKKNKTEHIASTNTNENHRTTTTACQTRSPPHNLAKHSPR